MEGDYKLQVKATDFFGLHSTSTLTEFTAYEGTPSAVLDITSVNPYVSVGSSASTTIESYNPDTDITFDASDSTVPDGYDIIEYRFDVNGDGTIDYAEVREAGTDGLFGTADDVYSAYTGTVNNGADGLKGTPDDVVNKVSVLFDGNFDGKYTHSFSEGEVTSGVLNATVQVLSDSGVASTSLNTLWNLNQKPTLTGFALRSTEVEWYGAPATQGIFNLNVNPATPEVFIDATYRSGDVETFISKYVIEWDRDGDGTLEKYVEERKPGTDGIFNGADEFEGLNFDGTFDGKTTLNFAARTVATGSTDIREIKVTVFDSMGASNTKSNFIVINEAPTTDATAINSLTNTESINFATGQNIVFDSQANDVNKNFTNRALL